MTVHVDDDRPDTVARLCPGPCNRDYHRAATAAANELHAAHYAGRDHNPAIVDHGVKPTGGAPVWCRAHQHRITVAVGRLPELAAALYVRTMHDAGKLAASGETGNVKRLARSHSPSGSPAWDAIDQLITWAATLEDKLRAEIGHEPSARDHWVGDTQVRATHLTTAVQYVQVWSTAWLSSDRLATHPEWGGQYALSLVNRAERAAGVDRLVHRLTLPCPSCDAKALAREDGADIVRCGYCGREWVEADYEYMAKVVASAHAV